MDGIFYDPKSSRKLKSIDILVFRITSNGICNSKPCLDCIKSMKQFNIRKIYYSTDDGLLKCEKISQIENSHRSQMTIHINSMNKH